MKYVKWTKDTAREQLSKRLRRAFDYRATTQEDTWRENERLLYNAVGYRDYGADASLSFNSERELLDLMDNSAPDIGINKIFKHIRFLHAQMSANPPAITARPVNTDSENRRKADAADRAARYARVQYNLQEKFDQSNLKTLSKGTGCIKTVFDPDKGEMKEFDSENEEVIMFGDICVSSPSMWDLWIDPDAKDLDEVKWVFERVWLSPEEFEARFPDMKDKMKDLQKGKVSNTFDRGSRSFKRTEEVQIPVYLYYEKALAINAMKGRHTWCLEDGTLLRDVIDNPHWDGQLPYHFLTDIDVEDQVYGKSIIEYEAPIQDICNRIDGATLDNIRNHSTVRMIVNTDSCEIEEDAIQDIPTQIIKAKGQGKPDYIDPPAAMPDLVRFRSMLENGGEQMAGLNESLVGDVKREISALALQTAIGAGNTTRRRLFNKFQLQVERVFKHILGLMQIHWDTPRIIEVLGKEHALEAVELQGADLAGGYDLTSTYGTSLSLDPARAREEIMQLWPLLEKAGVPSKTLLGFLKLNELEAIHDRMQLAADRQREIFEEMIANVDRGTPIYIEPEDEMDHAGMLEYAGTYLMSSDFKYLKDESKKLIKQHVKERRQMMIQEMTQAQGQAQPQAQGPQMPQLPVMQ